MPIQQSILQIIIIIPLLQNYNNQTYLFGCIGMQTQLYSQYEPLKWPPDLALAKVHIKCSCPGKDNIDGIECPCCGRYQKLKTRNWYNRDIIKDFKCYGGGIPTYFQLIKYCIVTLVILALIINCYHIYILQSICPLLRDNDIGYRCQTFLLIFKLCDPTLIYETLILQSRYIQAYIFFYLQMGSFIYLCLATIGMKWWIQRVNMKKIIKQQKIYSHFALMIKNIPRFYTLTDIKKQIYQISPQAEIVDLFYVYQIAELEQKFKKLFDLGFQIQYLKQSIIQQRGQNQATLNKKLQQYLKLYDQVQVLRKKIGVSNGRAIVVFNNKKHRDMIRKRLKITQCNKLIFHTLKFLGMNTQKMSLIADKIPQPQQIIWKYIGQSSATKTKVRIQTTIISIGFMLICFALLYFPMIKINQTNIMDKSITSTILGILISTILQIIAILYRQIILKLIPRRHPSSRQSQSYFIVITTVVFHFMFYIVVPVSYFVLTDDIPKNFKLKQLFIAVLTFLVMSFLVAIIDLRYRLSNSRRNKILSSWTNWGKYCQMRLHQQLKWPSFPIQFKLMVIFNIWSFNAFYIFQIPYLLVGFVILLFILYWLDKKNIYRHYKMQVYQSIDLQISVQRDYIVLFLICVCVGYALCAQQYWQYIIAILMFIISLILNFVISYQVKYNQKLRNKQRSQTLNQVIKTFSINPKASMRQNLLEMELRENYMILQQKSTISLGSASFQYGYQQLYDNYINNLRNKSITTFLQKIYHNSKKRITNLQILLQNKQPIDQTYSGNSQRNRESSIKKIDNNNTNQFMNRQSYLTFAIKNNNNNNNQQIQTQLTQRVIHLQPIKMDSGYNQNKSNKQSQKYQRKTKQKKQEQQQQERQQQQQQQNNQNFNQ